VTKLLFPVDNRRGKLHHEATATEEGTTMTEYELTFIVDPMDERVENSVMDTFDCIVGGTHTGDEFITMTALGDDGFHAATNAHMELMALGVQVERLEYDLADRKAIAERLDTTKQAVGNYIRGVRQASNPFPGAFNETGPVWLWADVVEWARRVLDVDPASGMAFPNRHEIVKFNACLDRQYEVPPAIAPGAYRQYRMHLPAPDETQATAAVLANLWGHSLHMATPHFWGRQAIFAHAVVSAPDFDIIYMPTTIHNDVIATFDEVADDEDRRVDY
jgi:hypothetical protein